MISINAVRRTVFYSLDGQKKRGAVENSNPARLF
jgi:hypothetical protein